MRFVELKSQAQLDPISLAAVMMVSAKYSAGAPLVSISVSIRDRSVQTRDAFGRLELIFRAIPSLLKQISGTGHSGHGQSLASKSSRRSPAQSQTFHRALPKQAHLDMKASPS
jgi:hypothetical protein